MNLVRDQIVSLQRKNYESSERFVPVENLYVLLDEKVVQEIVTICGVEAQVRDETVSIITSGARKIFAVLILMRSEILIRKFIEYYHQFQNEKLDAKLPLSEPSLKRIIGEIPAKEFSKEQWMFLSPYFRNDLSHRFLEPEVVLPFIKSKAIGEGGFGTVYEVTLHSRHQGVANIFETDPNLKLIRKQIKLITGDENQHQNEGDVLSVLRLVNHPNIVHLIASFTHRGTYNLLFFPADCDLKTLISQDHRSATFRSDTTFFIALRGLSSALATLHDFSASDFDIRKIGYHHDLKLSNILVDKNQFVLADFGLSRLKQPNIDSKTMFKGADSYYIAPECEFGDKALTPGWNGRKSDIWSFGCILLDVITYVFRGCNGVQDFEEGRKAKFGNWTLYQFHHAGKIHPFVQSWIQKLEQTTPAHISEIFAMIREMLEIDPSERPNAASVTAALSLLVVRSHMCSLEEAFDTLSASQADAYTLTIERERVKLWVTIVELDAPGNSWEALCGFLRTGVGFLQLNQSLSMLINFCNTLNIWSQNDLTFDNAVARQLRRHIDSLVNLLQDEYKEKLTSSLEIQFLANDSLSEVDRMRIDLEEAEVLPNLRLLAIAKLMATSKGSGALAGHVKRFEATQVDVQSDFGPESSLAKLKPSPEANAHSILVEWLTYDLQWTGEIGQELFKRVEELASTLRQADKPSGFLNLDCCGYFHNVRDHTFGLIFDFPVESVRSSRPSMLRHMISQLRTPETRPFLGQIFKLAHVLASSVLQFHKANWLHKNISSFNVCFFPTDDTRMAKSLTKPYMIGFNHSRQDHLNAFTVGPSTNYEHKDFSHPEYLKDKTRFDCIHDYYSLGLVLLEVGLWRTLDAMSQTMTGDDQSPENLRKFLIKKYVPRLGSSVGENYQNVVLKCLNSDFGPYSSSSTTNRIATLGNFEDDVVLPLSRCSA